MDSAKVEEGTDYYAMGYEAALAGNSNIPPAEVLEAGGLEAQASWNDGYADFSEEQGEA